MKLDDLTGRRFGKLTVKSYVGEEKWLCMCDCGRETIALASNLKRGHTTSCGCARANAPLHGKVFGNLCIIERANGDDPRRVYYRCKCDCGNECIVRSDALQSGDVKSCGKCKPFEEERIAALLESDTFLAGTQPSKLHSKITKANKSGIVGVNWDKSRGKWQASIRFRGHKYNLGRFDSKFEAAEIRAAAEKELFGNFLEWYDRYKANKDKTE